MLLVVPTSVSARLHEHLGSASCAYHDLSDSSDPLWWHGRISCTISRLHHMSVLMSLSLSLSLPALCTLTRRVLVVGLALTCFKRKKCGKEECPFCWPVKSSADVFTKLIKFKPHPQLARDENGVVVKDPCTDKQAWRSLEDLYFNNNNNTEEDRPMFRLGSAGQYEDSQVSTLLNKERVGSFVNCTLCNKRRCLYKRTNISLNR